MFNFLHTFNPNPILIELGPIKIHWYGLFIVLGILSALYIIIKLADYYKINKDDIIDISFWIIIFGILGGRAYDVLLEWPYYLGHPANIIKIWQGGLAIHGAIIAGLAATIYLTKKKSIPLLPFLAIITPGLALAQAIGRWGNYFNQELFGLPTKLPWGIPIDFIHRVPDYYYDNFFHPTFLYESLGNLMIFLILISLHYLVRKNKIKTTAEEIIIATYLILYSILRFSLEFIKIDQTPIIFSLRFPQIISIAIVISSIIWLVLQKSKKHATIE
ncbi:prolipoprotein diacylglyceryl transferase [Candidatus Parcubacteria bacterium]|nr:prolipoprotein diacylglyceryl transferase [Patescibacteria group bacterium]MBU4309898.1 prolipoprotein diacylglyceryl transferase [Patescibacteria group bacterium]MBU4431906.1 prolipoprotein diacylglyceryl transferase [Patescibacteria group bacterium]MBU4578237.1 prolipoprotein diacylglyceryl transferase [Patescibacteria group bacterium]MCG2696773.1 prolipoprotein diacylglyceryl transferase [Candidatus Parcubacteria bacterium]